MKLMIDTDIWIYLIKERPELVLRRQRRVANCKPRSRKRGQPIGDLFTSERFTGA